MGEGRQDNNKPGKAGDRVTIAEAAALLDVHPNTVRNRVKAGIYAAEKVMTENGQTWMLERNSILDNPLPKGSQQAPSQRKPDVELQATELVQQLLRPFVEDLGRVREELGAERVRRVQAEQDRNQLAAEQAAERGLREEAERERDELAARLKASTEPQDLSERVSEAVDSEEDVPPGSEHPVERPSWWRKFFGFE
jgi:regulator of protease activity HflC (stomatin/prohibitin superfamily)